MTRVAYWSVSAVLLALWSALTFGVIVWMFHFQGSPL